MKVIHSSLFRAICAIVIGALLIEYREQTVTWITIAIGILFFLSGVISLVSYYAAKHAAEKAILVHDADGNQITGIRPNFPLVGVGSLIFGAILALMPDTFIKGLVYMLAAILILGAITQFANLSTARRMGSVGFIFWVFPSVILLVGLVAVIKPDAIASAPLFVIGWAMVVYGVVECVNTLKISNNKRKWTKAEEISSEQPTAEDVQEITAIEEK